MELLVSDKVRRLYLELFALGNDLADHTLDVLDAVFLNSAAIELVEVLAGSSYVDIEDVNFGVGIFVTGEHGVLCGVHAADLGAVFLALFSARGTT